MKKIKYVGITAATLLAVAPVIGESVENTTAVHAATTETQVSNTDISTYSSKSPRQDAANAAISTLPKYIVFNNEHKIPNIDGFDKVMNQSYDKNSFSKIKAYLSALGFSDLMLKQIQEYLDTGYSNTIGYKRFSKTFHAPNSTITFASQPGAKDFKTAYDDMYKNGNDKYASLRLIFDMPKGPAISLIGGYTAHEDITFINSSAPGDVIQKPVRTDPVTQLGINYADNIALPTELETSQLKSDDNSNVVAIDQNGTPVDFSTSVGDLYYSQQDAFRQSGKTYDEDKLPKTDAVFFQPITITFDRSTSGVDLKTINDSMKQTAQKKGVSIKDLINQIISLGSKFTGMGGAGMGAQQDPAAAQKVSAISINGGTFTGFQSYPDYTNNSITFIRTLKVTPKVDPNKKPDVDPDHVNDAENWDVTPVSGILNVGGRNADLVDDNGKADNRSLGAGTPWITDQYRVNKVTKEGQYRVSTHEWVSEKDATFKQVQGNQATQTAFTSIVDIHPGTLHLSGKPVFKLYRKDGKQSNRSLAGNTDWYTDKIGYGADGSSYYRVSTDEWVKLTSGVQFK